VPEIVNHVPGDCQVESLLGKESRGREFRGRSSGVAGVQELQNGEVRKVDQSVD